jgi:hypothetical protein
MYRRLPPGSSLKSRQDAGGTVLLAVIRKEHGWQAHTVDSSTRYKRNKVAINRKIKRDELHAP